MRQCLQVYLKFKSIAWKIRAWIIEQQGNVEKCIVFYRVEDLSCIYVFISIFKIILITRNGYKVLHSINTQWIYYIN